MYGHFPPGLVAFGMLRLAVVGDGLYLLYNIFKS
ncbi:hypothetical protein Salpa_5433 [Sporomusa sp. KB1]|jgi:hypothetical protein|nr:hypothetical protein Salpa_5433 [Sporomusa sp. KB1]